MSHLYFLLLPLTFLCMLNPSNLWHLNTGDKGTPSVHSGRKAPTAPCRQPRGRENRLEVMNPGIPVTGATHLASDVLLEGVGVHVCLQASISEPWTLSGPIPPLLRFALLLTASAISETQVKSPQGPSAQLRRSTFLLHKDQT